jgi:endonuclease/exonuclease/phosphatase family metal-dependent hydrolase
MVQVRRAAELDQATQQVTEQVAVLQWELALLQVQELLRELPDVPVLQELERQQEQPDLAVDQCLEAAQQEAARLVAE